MAKNKPSFSRGYDVSRDLVQKNPYYLRSCFNCQYYMQDSGDTEEVCQNPDVISYDMVVEGNRVYCLKWQPLTTSKNMFNNRKGRSRLD